MVSEGSPLLRIRAPLSINVSLASHPATPNTTPDGRLRFKRKLGAGSEGSIFEATSISGRRLAVKVVPHGLSNHYAQLFRLKDALRHPNISPCLDMQVDKHFCYLVTELCRGDLLQVIQRSSRNGRLLEREAAQYLAQIASALGHCHRARVYHRDVKPENILIGQLDGVAFLADFGTALVLEDKDRRGGAAPRRNHRTTAVGTAAAVGPAAAAAAAAAKATVAEPEEGNALTSSPLGSPASSVGSPAYMAPEIIHPWLPHLPVPATMPPELQYRLPMEEEEAAEAGFDPAAADVWSLGVTLFCMVTGHRPWDSAEDSDTTFRRLRPGSSVFRPYSSVFPDYLSLPLRDLLQSMLAFRSSDRPSLDEVLRHPWLVQHITREENQAPPSNPLSLLQHKLPLEGVPPVGPGNTPPRASAKRPASPLTAIGLHSRTRIVTSSIQRTLAKSPTQDSPPPHIAANQKRQRRC